MYVAETFLFKFLLEAKVRFAGEFLASCFLFFLHIYLFVNLMERCSEVGSSGQARRILIKVLSILANTVLPLVPLKLCSFLLASSCYAPLRTFFRSCWHIFG